MSKTAISVDHIARVEGHGNVHLTIEGGQVVTCEMNVVEPARLFESMVVGRKFADVPYIASRVCGICSASHVITDILAIERVFGVPVIVPIPPTKLVPPRITAAIASSS